jgi:hypothetical protein
VFAEFQTAEQGQDMKTAVLALTIGTLATVAACSKSQTYESRGEVDSAHDTTSGVHMPNISVGMKTDTVNVPTITTQKDTIIVDKPVISGRKPVTVKTPTFEKEP